MSLTKKFINNSFATRVVAYDIFIENDILKRFIMSDKLLMLTLLFQKAVQVLLEE